MGSASQRSVEETVGAEAAGLAVTLEQGASIGRYIVLRRLDEGGMGVVYAAYDPELDRRIALKVLHPSRSSKPSRSRGHGRLLREAQALARLSHTNVVAVHDVGTHEDSVFIAMEFVEGETLSRWVRRGDRSWRRVLAVLVEAGRGLQAAHDAGLVHRDFKPDNVMVEASGRARVLDFGLARAGEPLRLPTAPSDASQSLAALTVSSPLTVAGALLGTPAYMAPEQFTGEECDARSDQFSFCISAWQALYGRRPFDGDTPHELSSAVLTGAIVEPADNRRVPRSVRRALTRGLSTDRADRFPSMEALLDELARDAGTQRTKWGLASGIVGSGIALAWVATRPPTVCDDGRERLADVWDAPAQSDVAQQFAAVPQFGVAAWERVQAGVDRYANLWVDTYVEACAATRVHATQSEEALDLRMGCLDERRRGLGALVDVLRVADVDTVEASLDAVTALQPLSVCSDLDSLRARVRPPEDPAIARKVDNARAELAGIAALFAAGKDTDAQRAVAPLLERARSIAYEPLLAEVELEASRSDDGVGGKDIALQLQRDAFFRARAVGHDEIARTAAIALVGTFGEKFFDLDRALEWEAHARAELAHTPSSAAEVALESALATAYRHAGKYTEGVVHARRALDLSEPTDAARARALRDLASALAENDDREPSRAAYIESLALHEEVFGPDHPATVNVVNGYASALALWGEPDGALPFSLRAVEMWRRTRPGSQSLAGSLLNLGLAQHRAREYDSAIRTLEEALELVSKLDGPRHSRAGKIHGNMGLALTSGGDPRRALEHHLAALDIFVEAHGATHPLVGMSEANVAIALEALDDPHRAVEHYERAWALLEPAFGADDPRLLDIVLDLAKLERDRGQLERAAEWDARAARITAAEPAP